MRVSNRQIRTGPGIAGRDLVADRVRRDSTAFSSSFDPDHSEDGFNYTGIDSLG